jgi:hypothetical protein
LALNAANVEKFFAAYPDGTLISLVREPLSWHASARQLWSKLRDVEQSLTVWRRSAEAAIAARAKFGQRVLLLTYEKLVLEPESTMAKVAERLGIDMSPILLAPTFNARPIRANSSERVATHGIVREPATAARVTELGADLYERAQALAL